MFILTQNTQKIVLDKFIFQKYFQEEFWILKLKNTKYSIYSTTANAQRDDRPAEYRWRPLLNATKFGSRPVLDSAVQ